MTMMQARVKRAVSAVPLDDNERQRVSKKIAGKVIDLMTYADRLGLDWEAIYKDAHAIYRKESGQSWWRWTRCWWWRRS